MQCFGCGVEKDPKVLEEYSHPETDRICDGPVPPLFVIECQPTGKDTGWKAVVVCHECFHRLDPDMWISERCWESLNPTTPFDKLPSNNLDIPDRWNPENYQTKE